VTARERIEAKRARGEKVLAPYLCAGYPTAEATLPLMRAAADAGADCLELGVPFSDPLADGGMLQRAALQALRGGMTLSRALDAAAAFTAERPEVPVFLMSYLNPLWRMGPGRFAARARAAQVAGCIVPDLPPEAQASLRGAGAPPLVQFVAPNTPEERVRALAALDPPFLYCISLLGVTGGREGLSEVALPSLLRVRRVTEVPTLVGFGVRDGVQAARLAGAADGVIVGSALAQALGESTDSEECAGKARSFLSGLRRALDGAGRREPCC